MLVSLWLVGGGGGEPWRGTGEWEEEEVGRVGRDDFISVPLSLVL